MVRAGSPASTYPEDTLDGQIGARPAPAHRPRGRNLVLLLAVVAMGGLGTAATAFAAPSGGPSLTIAPSVRLGDGQFVKASWAGFGRGQLVFFRQCDAAPTDLAGDCAPAYRLSAPSASDGQGATFLPITRGEIEAQDGGSFTCDDGHACSLAVLTDPGDLSTAAFSALTFAPSADTCPELPEPGVVGAGPSTAALAFRSWSAIACRPPLGLPLRYSASDSAGRGRFIAGDHAFVGASSPFSHGEQVRLYEAGRGYVYAPVATSGLVLVSNIHERDRVRGEAGPRITDLRLTAEDVARVFTGQVGNWHLDERINDLNPSYRGKLPPSVRPMVLGGTSASTYLFTSWLSAAAPRALPRAWSGPTGTFPAGGYLSPGNVRETATDLAAAIAAPEEADPYQFGSIGYVDSSIASYYGLATVKIENAAGRFVDATPRSIGAALRDLRRNPDGMTGTPAFGSKDPRAYPMPAVSYVVGPTNGTDPETAGDLAGFIRWATGPGQHEASLPAGYVPLPPALARQAEIAADAIQRQDGEPVVPTATPGAGGKGAAGPPPAVPPDRAPGRSGTGPGAEEPAPGVPPCAEGDGDCAAAPGEDPERAPFPSTSSSATRLILPSLAAFAFLGLAAGPGVQAVAAGSPLHEAIRRRFARSRR